MAQWTYMSTHDLQEASWNIAIGRWQTPRPDRQRDHHGHLRRGGIYSPLGNVRLICPSSGYRADFLYLSSAMRAELTKTAI